MPLPEPLQVVLARSAALHDQMLVDAVQQAVAYRELALVTLRLLGESDRARQTLRERLEVLMGIRDEAGR